MSPENAPALELQTGMGEISRLTGVFFEPKKTFADIAERPKWLMPLALVILATVAYYVTYGQHIGWHYFIEDQMQNNARMQQQMERLPADQRDKAIDMQTRIVMPLTYYVGPVIGMPVAYLFGSVILLGIVSGLMSAGIRYKQIFAIQCYAGLTAIVSKALSIVVIFLKKPEEFNLMNPLAFNPAAFMDPKATPKFLYTVATGFDLFTFWGMILVAIGIKAAAGKRLSFGSALFAVFLPWAVFLLVGGSLASIFS